MESRPSVAPLLREQEEQDGEDVRALLEVYTWCVATGKSQSAPSPLM